jgi:hypothetical protein
MLVFVVAAMFATLLSALALRKLLRGQSFLGGDLFWIATTTYLWFLAFAQATVVWRDAAIHQIALDRGWLLVGGGALVLLTLAYSKANWPPFRMISSYANVEFRK